MFQQIHTLKAKIIPRVINQCSVWANEAVGEHLFWILALPHLCHKGAVIPLPEC